MRAFCVVAAFIPLDVVATQSVPEWMDRDGVAPAGLVVRDSALPLRMLRADGRTSELQMGAFRLIAAGVGGTSFLMTEHAVYDWAQQRTIRYEVNGASPPFPAALYAYTHFFDGVAWTRLQASYVRSGAAMAFDPARGCVLSFGGEAATATSTQLNNDTWELAGTTWAQVTTGGPSPRKHAAMARTATGLVLFGGEAGSTRFADTWLWNGTNWSLAAPAMSPPARSKASMSFDPNTGHALLYGGMGAAGAFGDTWRWTGTTWVSVASPAGTAPLLEPQLTCADGRTWLVGHEGPLPELQRVEEWDGVAWTTRVRRASPSVRDNQRTIAFDEVRSEIVMFGGNGPTFGTYFDDTWTYDGSWSRRTPPVSPSPRGNAGMGFDRANSVTVLFGGVGPIGYLGDTWLWSGTAWTLAQPTGTPSPRAFATLAFHPPRGTLVLHGGMGLGGLIHSDTYEWDGVTWSGLPSAPLASRDSFLAFDEARGVMALYQQHGGTSNSYATHSEFTGAAWSSPVIVPNGRFGYDPDVGAQVITTGGVRHTFIAGQWIATPLTTPTGGPLLTDVSGSRLLCLQGAFLSDCEVFISTVLPARAEPYGTGCGPVRPIVLGCGSRPFLGSKPRLDVACATPGAPAWLFLGLQSSSASIAGGCTAYADVLVHVAAGTAGTDGWARFPFVVPNGANLLGLTLFAQAVVADPAGLGFSNGMSLHIGW